MGRMKNVDKPKFCPKCKAKLWAEKKKLCVACNWVESKGMLVL